ncbi:MAG: xanthine dehydrogenase family protein subunit M [Candidatus Aminicenantes bacterium]|nr:xanthine dehydrogenase family protein subunit M [Candidatus Aminicenantes bacterium]
MSSFQYAKPASIEQVTSFLAKVNKKAFLLAGGTDLLAEIKEGIIEPDVVVDLKAIPNLSYIKKERDGVAIGALTTVAELAENPIVLQDYRVLHEAARVVASPQLRNMGTVGGNLCQRPRCWYYRDGQVLCTKKGGTKCYAEKGRNKYHAILGGGICYAVYPSDLAPALIALEAKAVIASPQGERTVPLAEFYTPPLVNVRKENILSGQEVLKEVCIPPAKRGDKSVYMKFTERGAWDFAVVSVAAKGTISGGTIEDIRIVCGGVAPMPWRLRKAEDLIKGRRASDTLIRQAAKAALADAKPLEENGYKVDLLETVLVRTVASLIKA